MFCIFLIDISVTIVVQAVALFCGGLYGAFTDDVTMLAGQGSGLAGALINAAGIACALKVFVDFAVAIIVATIAGLDAAVVCGAGVLASIGDVLVYVIMSGDTFLELASAIDAAGDAKKVVAVEGAGFIVTGSRAAAAILGIISNVVIFIDFAIAIVVDAITAIGAIA